MQKQQIINFFTWTFVSIVGLLVGTVVLVMVLGVLAMHPYIGFLPESQFRLAPESRLPNWFNLPSCSWNLLFIDAVDLEEKSVSHQKSLRPLFFSVLSYLIGIVHAVDRTKEPYSNSFAILQSFAA